MQTEKEYRLNELNNKECKEVRCRESKELRTGRKGEMVNVPETTKRKMRRIKGKRYKKKGQTGTVEKFYNSSNINLSNLVCL